MKPKRTAQDDMDLCIPPNARGQGPPSELDGVTEIVDVSAQRKEPLRIATGQLAMESSRY
jgi:hypothetical protein